MFSCFFSGIPILFSVFIWAHIFAFLKHLAEIAVVPISHLFSHIGTFSGALLMAPGQDIKQVYNGVFADANKFNNQVHALFMGQGSEERMGTEAMCKQLTDLGIHNTYYSSPGTHHEWLTWRRCLNQFIPMLFNEK